MREEGRPATEGQYVRDVACACDYSCSAQSVDMWKVGSWTFSFLLSFHAPLRLAVKLWISIPYLQPVKKLSRREQL
jgi:hypothetical protein